MRWRDKTVSEVFCTEFRYTPATLEAACGAGHILVNQEGASPETILRNGDKIENTIIVTEPPIRRDPILILAE